MLAKMEIQEKAVDSPAVQPVDQDSVQTWPQSLRSPHSSNLASEDHATKIDLLHLGPAVSEKQDWQTSLSGLDEWMDSETGMIYVVCRHLAVAEQEREEYDWLSTVR
jgi:hypothetical protein